MKSSEGLVTVTEEVEACAQQMEMTNPTVINKSILMKSTVQ